MTGPGTSGTTTRWPRRCGGWWPAGLLPERAGQPVKAWVHISLADLLLLDGDSALQEQWTAQVRDRWAARRAFASETGSERRRLAGRRRRRGDRVRRGDGPDRDRRRQRGRAGGPGPAVRGTGPARARDGRRRPDTTAAWAALEQAVIGKAVDLLSGPGGLASFLRRRQLGARLGGPSLPLDIGYSETIPAGIRNAVMLRDRHCQWAGGCNQPAVGVRGAPHEAQGQRRQDQPSRTASFCARSTTRS